MRKLSRTLTIALGILLSSPVIAQIPVTDSASIAQQVTNQLETVAKWKIQYDQMITQIDQLKQQYASVTGSRNLGQILNNAELRDYLPDDWQTVYDSVKHNGYAGLSGTGLMVYDQNKVYDGCQHLTITQQRMACETQAVKGAQDKGFALDAYDKARSRIDQIDQLMAKIDETPDPKAIAELQGRLTAEQALIQNEQTKLQMYQMVANAEDRVQQQRQKEINAKANARRGWIQPTIN